MEGDGEGRYTAPTILALLQEVAQFAGVKIDWNTLVKKTSTGISSAREYQMLWRHLAYHDILVEKLDDGAEPLDDDSDLEFELEPVPAVSGDASTEAAACVKVLIASGLPNDSGPMNPSTVEAPLTINIPNGLASRTPSDNSQILRSTQGTNITIPVSVQKQPLPTVPSVEGLDGNGILSTNLPAKRKRKLWTAEEDMELIAAVQKCGEGNWANMLRGDFKHDRTASQLSQRWAIIRKRKANLNRGSTSNSTGTTLSEAQLAARQAVSIALNMPMMGSLSAMCSIGTGTHSTSPSNSSTLPATTADALPISTLNSSSQASYQSQQAPNQGDSHKGKSNRAPKSQAATKTPSVPMKCSIQEVAFAAGARIANPSTAASLLKAAQSRNAVHIRQGGTSLSKSSLSTPRLHGKDHSIRKPKKLPGPTHYSPMPSVTQPSVSVAATSSDLPAQQEVQSSKPAIPVCAMTVFTVGSSSGEEAKCAENRMDSSANVLEVSVQDPASLPISKELEDHTMVDVAGSNPTAGNKTGENPAMVEKQTELSNMEVGEDPTMVEKQIDFPNMEVCENSTEIENQTQFSNMEVGDNSTIVEEQSDFSYMEVGEDPIFIEKQSDFPNLQVGENPTAVEKPTDLPNMTVEVFEAIENPIGTEKQTRLSNLGVGENQTTIDTYGGSQSPIEKQMVSSNNDVGGIQSMVSEAVVEPESDLPNEAKSES
ncbi:uncharacterized protein LOC143849633 isoform X2 [Tasmannia lanceolata]|uniref:uncharacterized protein LOC143849633 isoform X2 n=1 Tax=Tasmannia lanceolata TaxID=3420 RepID=UPI004063EE4C